MSCRSVPAAEATTVMPLTRDASRRRLPSPPRQRGATQAPSWVGRVVGHPLWHRCGPHEEEWMAVDRPLQYMVALDCADPQGLARFYAELLGWEIDPDQW